MDEIFSSPKLKVSPFFISISGLIYAILSSDSEPESSFPIAIGAFVCFRKVLIPPA